MIVDVNKAKEEVELLNQEAIEASYEIFIKEKYELEKRVQSELIPLEPIINLDGMPFIYPNTLTTIQGKAGSYKSRVAQQIGATLIRPSDCGNNGLNTSMVEKGYSLVYFDTERNIKFQLPSNMQHLIRHACLDHLVPVPLLEYYSLSNVKRENRFTFIKRVIDEKYIVENKKAVIIIDIITDCISDINNSKDSVVIIDYLNKLINESDCTIIVIIHENPAEKSSKARGHIGTEFLHKSSTCVQIEKLKDDCCRINLLKIRDDRAGGFILGRFNPNTKIIEIIKDPKERKQILADNNTKGISNYEISKFIVETVKLGISQIQLVQKIGVKYNIKPKTAANRLREIRSEEIILEGKKFILKSEKMERKNYITLEQIK